VLEVFGDRWLKERVGGGRSAYLSSRFLTFAVRRELRVADLTGPALNRLGPMQTCLHRTTTP